MKKILLLSSFCLLFSVVSIAQDSGRFYVSVQAGPKVSFSNSISSFGSETNIKGGRQGGLLFGYAFGNKRVTLETGAFLSLHKYAIDFEPFSETEKFDEYDSFHALQIPLRLKVAINEPGSNVVFRTIIGIAFLHPFYWKGPSSFQGKSLDEFNVRTRDYEFDNRTVQFGYYQDPVLSSLVHSQTLLAEVGLEVEAKLNNRFRLVGNLIYQNGFRPVATKYYAYNFDYKGRNTELAWEDLVVTSKAEALNFNAGLVYSLRK